MVKKRNQFSGEEVDELKRCVEANRDRLARDRCRAVYLYGTGHPVREILEQIRCSRTALMGWCRRYRQLGIAGLLDHRRGGNRARLTSAQIGDLTRHLQSATGDQPGWTVEELAQLVSRRYGVRYKSRTSYHNLFQKCGLNFNRKLDRFVPDAGDAPST